MEKFKACEKEMKTKAFSKEGLTQSAKLDPKAQEKLEITAWLQQSVEDLTLQVEQSEAEIESLQGGGKKRGKGQSSTAGRLDELERLNERRKWHISRLELILRLLDNGSLTTDRVLTLKEDVTYFVESNTVCSPIQPPRMILIHYTRRRTLMKIWAFMTTSTSRKRKRNSVWPMTTMRIATIPMHRAKVTVTLFICLPPPSPPNLIIEPPQRSTKKHDKDEESVASGSKRDDSPIQKKPGVGLQLRSEFRVTCILPCLNDTVQKLH